MIFQTKNNKKIILLLRWKNGNGLLGPACEKITTLGEKQDYFFEMQKITDENKTQILLSQVSDIPFNYTMKDVLIKTLAKNCSKKNNNKPGKFDAWYYDPQTKTLIIAELKAFVKQFDQAKQELIFYNSKIVPNIDSNQISIIFYIAFCGQSTNDFKFEVMQLKEDLILYTYPTLNINLSSFNLIPQQQQPLNQQSIDQQIHSIHNLLRNLSNEDKNYFIGAILLGLQDQNYINYITGITQLNGQFLSNILIETIKQKYNDQELIQSLQFIPLSFDNNNLQLISKKVYDLILNTDQKQDILNKFYSEFCRYQNTDSKSLGIVLTPQHIVKLMTYLLNIQPNDNFIDLCSGTGSFGKEASNHTNFITSIEYQQKLYTLLKINFIIQKIINPQLQYQVIHQDCFNIQYQQLYDKSAINPPYGQKGQCKEINFILKQLYLLKEGGLCCAIVPENIFNQSKKEKQEILKQSQILRIIKCNPKLFDQGMGKKADVSTEIILLRKQQQGNVEPTLFQNYSNDQVEIVLKQGRQIINRQKFEENYNKIINNEGYSQKIDENQEWKWKDQNQITLPQIINQQNEQFLIKEYEKIQQQQLQKLKEQIEQKQFQEYQYKFSIIFELVGNGKAFQKDQHQGDYPFVSACIYNNGISSKVDSFDYQASPENPLYSIGKLGAGAGYMFKHTYNFKASNNVIIVKPKQNLYDAEKYITEQLKRTFSYTNTLTWDRLVNETIILPYDINNYHQTKPDLDFIEDIKQESIQLLLQKSNEILQKQQQQLQNLKEYHYKFSDIFELVGRGNRDINKQQPGPYPLLSSTKFNNGAGMFINEFDYNASPENPLYGINRIGSCGYCFKQTQPFAATDKVIIFKPKFKLPDDIQDYISVKFSQQYSHHNSLTQEKILNETIILPYKLQEINTVE